MYVGGIWGFHTHVEMWLNHADPTKSDAILYFTNLLSTIPAGMHSCTTSRKSRSEFGQDMPTSWHG